MSIDSSSKRSLFNLERASNFMRQFRDPDSRELKKLSANQFMEVWSHYDRDGNGYIEGTELDGFLKEFVSSANFQDISPDMKFAIVLVAFASLVAAGNTAAIDSARNNFIIGNHNSGDILLFSTYVFKPASAGSVQWETVVYDGSSSNTRITSIQAREVGATQRGRVTLRGGGIGHHSVNVQFTSAYGQGYHYLLDIFGRPNH